MDYKLESAKIMRQRKPATLGGIFDCAVADGRSYEDAWAIVDAHYKNYGNQDYDAACGKGLEATQ